MFYVDNPIDPVRNSREKNFIKIFLGRLIF